MTTSDRAFIDRRFPALDAMRAVGAILVVLTHAAFNTGRINDGWTGAVLARFDFGVTIFFILSGFLLSRPWFLAAALGTPAPSTAHYFWKRALRILPLYWLVVVVALAFDPANGDADWREWLSELTLTQLYRHGLLASSLTQMWSLCTEVAFYVLLPLLCVLLTGRRARRLNLTLVLRRVAAIGVLGVVWQVSVATIPGSEGHYAQWLPGFLPWFGVGMAFAAVSASITVDPRPHVLERLAGDLPGCWLLAVGAFAVACSPIAGPRLLLTPGAWEAGSKVVLYTVAGAFLLLPLIFGPERDGWVRTQLAGPVLGWLGRISYGIFAIHMLVLNLVFHLLDLQVFTGRFLTVAAATLAITIVLATASYHLLEKQVMKAKNLPFVARREPRGTPSEPATEIAP